MTSNEISLKTELVRFIAKHIEIEVETHRVTENMICAFTGEQIASGEEAILLTDVLNSMTVNATRTFCDSSDVVLPEVAKLFKAKQLRGSLYVSEHGIQYPVISSRVAIIYKRPTWCEIFRNLSGKSIIILTNNRFHQLWPDAQITETDTLLEVLFNNEREICYLSLSKYDLLRA